MYKRDYFIKQIEEFSKVLGVILGLKKDGNFSDLNELIHTTSLKYTSTEIEYAEILDNERLIETLTEDKKLNDDQLKMLADLLFEKAEYYLKNNSPINEANNCYKKSYLIYSFLKTHSTQNYSLDMHYKLEILSKMDL